MQNKSIILNTYPRLQSVTLKPRIAIIIPAYNEAETLPRLLEEIEQLREITPQWEVSPIVIDDGSTDRTPEVLERLSEKIPPLRVVRHPFNLGIGCSVQTGFQVAVEWGCHVAVQLDGDGQHPPSELPHLIEPLLRYEADVIVGSRYVRGAGGNVSTRSRRWGTWLFSILLRVLVGARIQDATSGYRAFNFEAADFLARCYPDDYPEVQAYVPLMRRKFLVKEVPVSMKKRSKGRSSIQLWQGVYYMWKVALATTLDRVRPLPLRKHSKDRPEGLLK